MVTYRYLVVEGRTGQIVGELPFSQVTYDEILSGVGSFHGTLPLEHPKAIPALIRPGSREIGVIRIDGGVETCVWNGPIVNTDAGLRDGTVEIDCASPMWYFGKRVSEFARDYVRTKTQIMYDLFDKSVIKTGGNLANFTCDNLTIGPNINYKIGSADRRVILQVMNELASDPSTGFDYRVDFNWSPGLFRLDRHLSIHYPTLGSTLNQHTMQPPAVTDFRTHESLDRAANRVHVIGGQSGKTALRADQSNTASIAAGYLLLERAFDRSGIGSQGVLNAMAADLRRLLNPAVRTYEVSFRPSTIEQPTALPFDFCDLGDTIPLNVQRGYIQFINAYQRVIHRSVSVDQGGVEEVTLTFADPAGTVTD